MDSSIVLQIIYSKIMKMSEKNILQKQLRGTWQKALFLTFSIRLAALTEPPSTRERAPGTQHHRQSARSSVVLPSRDQIASVPFAKKAGIGFFLAAAICVLDFIK